MIFKRILPILFQLCFYILASSQSYPLEIEQFNKRLNLRIADPNISVHFPTGLIYEDIGGGAFTNLSDYHLRIADSPFGFQIQNQNVIYSEQTKNTFSINHYDTPWDNVILLGPSRRAFWGPRNSVDPFYYDLKTFGNIYNVDLADRRLTEMTDNNSATGALRFYRYDDPFFSYIHTLTISNSGQPVWLAVSDRRTKEEISPSSKILPLLLKLQLKKYKYKGNELETTGFIAQEVQQVFPDLVEEMEDGHLGVNYMGFSPLAIQAINEQQDIINSLSARLIQVEKILSELEK